MIPIYTKVTSARKEDVKICINQKITDGPENLLDRKVTLMINNQEAIDVAIRILYELVPVECLKGNPDLTTKIKKIFEASHG